MPMKSQAQRRLMWALHPEIAKRWEKETPEGSLPERVKEATMTSTRGIVRNILGDNLGAAKVAIYRNLEEKLHGAIFEEYQSTARSVMVADEVNYEEVARDEQAFRDGFRAAETDIGELVDTEAEGRAVAIYTRARMAPNWTSKYPPTPDADYALAQKEDAFREGYRAAEKEHGGLVDVNAEGQAVAQYHRTHPSSSTVDEVGLGF